MSSTTIIAVIVAALVILVAYAFISQTIERKRKQRQRLLTALRLRCRDFKYMASSFPAGFLPKDLNIILYQCLVETCGRLSELEPNEKIHAEELSLFNQQLNEARRLPPSHKRTSLTSAAQIQEVSSLLQALNGLVTQQQQRGSITEAQLQQYSAQIKHLVTQATVDSHILSAKKALNSQKPRVAIHFYTLAKKLLTKESGEVNYHKQIEQLNGAIAQLELRLTEHAASDEQTASDNPEWEDFGKENAWQKKSLYDD
jgi:chromosome segregation ATPase